MTIISQMCTLVTVTMSMSITPLTSIIHSPLFLLSDKMPMYRLDESVPRSIAPSHDNKTAVARVVNTLSFKGHTLWTFSLCKEIERPRRSESQLWDLVHSTAINPESDEGFEDSGEDGSEKVKKAVLALAAVLALGESHISDSELRHLDDTSGKLVMVVARGQGDSLPIYPEEQTVALMAAAADSGMRSFSRSAAMALWSSLEFRPELLIPSITPWALSFARDAGTLKARRVLMENAFR